MGTSKKLMLASLVGMMVVLACIIGLAPLHQANDTGVAASDDGRVDMADVLDMVLGKALDSTQIELQSSYKVYTSTVLPGDYVSVPVTASVPSGPTSDTLTFVLNAPDQGTPQFPDPIADPLGTWEGPLGSPAISAHAQHYAGRLDVADSYLSVLSKQSTVTTFLVYALSNATQSALAAMNSAYATYDFDGSSELLPGSTITIVEDDTIDADGNGIPNDPATIPAGSAYTTNSGFFAKALGNGEVLFANLDNPTNFPNVFTVDGLEIAAPTSADLEAAGVIGASDDAFLLVKRVNNPADMPDQTPGFADGAAFAADVATKAAALGSEISSEFLITILAGAPGNDLVEVGNLNGADIRVRIDATITTPASVQVQGFDISVLDVAGSINVVGLGAGAAWNQLDASPSSNQINGFVDGVITSGAASLVAAFEIVDNPPVANCTDITVDLVSGTATIANNATDNGSTDDNGIATFALSQTTFTCADLGVNSVTLTVTDTNGQTDTCVSNVTVTDTTSSCALDQFPVANCRSITVNLDGSGFVHVDASQIDNGSTDDVGIASIVLSQDDFTCADLGANNVTLTVTDTANQTDTCNATITVTDTLGACSAGPATLTGISANQIGGTQVDVWLFGGVVVSITGTNLTNTTPITIGSRTVTGFRAAADGTSVEVVIPAYSAAGSSSNINLPGGSDAVDVSAGVSTLVDAVVYHQVSSNAAGVTGQAFWFRGPYGTAVDVVVPGQAAGSSQLEIPSIDSAAGQDIVYGIVRNGVVDVAKQNTGVLYNTAGLGSLGNADLSTVAAIDAGNSVQGGLDFTVNLYADAGLAKQNTPPVGAGTLTEASNQLINFPRGVDANGNPVQGPAMTLTFPTDATGLTAVDVRNGMSMWGAQSNYDYVANIVTVNDVDPTAAGVQALVEYQSQILANSASPDAPAAIVGPMEVVPRVVGDSTTGTPDATAIDAVSKARLYTLNGFSLRRNAILPPDVVAGIYMATGRGNASGNFDGPSGPQCGGTSLTVSSVKGGLGWIDHISVTTVALSKHIDVDVAPADILTPAGSDEYNVTFLTPEVSEAGVVDITLHMKSGGSVTLPNAFKYENKKRFPLLLLLLLGLLLAGLTDGGEDGGGGGPCFIASAAYGTPMAAEIDTLRNVRDGYMLTNGLGTAFVDTYYRISPTIADQVAKSPVLAAVVRAILVPVIFFGNLILNVPALLSLIALSIGMIHILRSRKSRSRA